MATAAPAIEAEQALAERRVALGQAAIAAGTAAAAARTEAAAAGAEATRAAAAATEAAAALRALLPVAHQLALWPAETVLAAPVPAADALRGLALLAGLARRVAERAAAASAAADGAQRRARQAAALAARLDAAEQAARAADDALDRAIAVAREERARRVDAAAAATAATAQAAARTRNLDTVVERVARAPVVRAIPDAATVVAPVGGSVARGFGESGQGSRSHGLTYAAAPGARVLAPCGGRTVFAGPFRSYGQLLIIDCGGGRHAVLGGLARLDSAAGDRLLAREPVGVLGRGEGGRASLYLEFRQDGEPVDPARLLAGG